MCFYQHKEKGIAMFMLKTELKDITDWEKHNPLEHQETNNSWCDAIFNVFLAPQGKRFCHVHVANRVKGHYLLRKKQFTWASSNEQLSLDVQIGQITRCILIYMLSI